MTLAVLANADRSNASRVETRMTTTRGLSSVTRMMSAGEILGT